jgi:hypothetical protein
VVEVEDGAYGGGGFDQVCQLGQLVEGAGGVLDARHGLEEPLLRIRIDVGGLQHELTSTPAAGTSGRTSSSTPKAWRPLCTAVAAVGAPRPAWWRVRA